MIRKHRKDLKQSNNGFNNRGFTLIEMVTTFALLGIFLVAVTRLISYTVTLYHETQGTSLGMQVSDMIAARVQGVVEDSTMILTDWFYTKESTEDQGILESNGFDKGFLVGGDDHIMLKDGNEVVLEIYKDPKDPPKNEDPGYLVIRYNEIPEQYDVHEWRFDEKAYMGYQIKSINFAMAEQLGGTDKYGPNVVYMKLILTSPKYGEFTSEYYIKAPKVKSVTNE